MPSKPTERVPKFSCPPTVEKDEVLTIQVIRGDIHQSYPVFLKVFDAQTDHPLLDMNRRALKTNADGAGTLNVHIPSMFSMAAPIGEGLPKTGKIDRPEVENVRIEVTIKRPSNHGEIVFTQTVMVLSGKPTTEE